MYLYVFICIYFYVYIMYIGKVLATKIRNTFIETNNINDKITDNNIQEHIKTYNCSTQNLLKHYIKNK